MSQLPKKYFNSYSPSFNIKRGFGGFCFVFIFDLFSSHSWFPALVSAVFSLIFSRLFPHEQFSVSHVSKKFKPLAPRGYDQKLVIIPSKSLLFYLFVRKALPFIF